MDSDPRYIAAELIELEWRRALALSGLPDDNVTLVLCDAELDALRVGSVWMAPNIPTPLSYFFDDRGAWERAARAPIVHRHRISFPARFPTSATALARVGAILAHELHHVVEYEHGGRLGLQLQDVVEFVLAELHGSPLPGAAVNAIPYEADADAAAARYLRSFHKEAIPAILASDDPSPARATEPPLQPTTLQQRTVDFIRTRVKELGRPLHVPTSQTSLLDWLERCSPGAAAIYALDREVIAEILDPPE